MGKGLYNKNRSNKLLKTFPDSNSHNKDNPLKRRYYHEHKNKLYFLSEAYPGGKVAVCSAVSLLVASLASLASYIYNKVITAVLSSLSLNPLKDLCIVPSQPTL